MHLRHVLPPAVFLECHFEHDEASVVPFAVALLQVVPDRLHFSDDQNTQRLRECQICEQICAREDFNWMPA